MTDARKYFEMEGDFAMRHGGTLSTPTVAYETWGTLNDDASNAILIFTGLSPSAHAASSVEDPSAGWWEDMVGQCRPIDSEKFFVICFNNLGSCFGTTGPASVNPATGETYRLGFPLLALEDIASLGAHLLDHLGVRRLACAIGPSMGGMTALAFCMMFPERAGHLISVSSASRALPFAIALRSLQRELVRGDPAWNKGNYPPDAQPVNGMRMARKLGMITYRSAEEWRHRFGRERISQSMSSGDMFGDEFEVQSYLQAHAIKFTGAFDANCYIYLSHAMDLFDAAEHGVTLEAAVASVQLDSALVLGVHSDILFPVPQQRELADLLEIAGCEVDFHALDSIQGHDSFLVDMDRFRPRVADYLLGIHI